jgi:integrase
LLGARNTVVAKPTKHRGKWRVRWVDDQGRRQSAVFDDYRRAQTELSLRQVDAEEIKRGIRNAAPPEKTFNDLCDYWIEKRAPRKRSRKDDESIIRRHLRPAFGEMKLRDLGVEEVDGYINDKIDAEELSDKTVNNHVTLLATMLRTATTFKAPWVLSVPRFRKPKVALFGRDYQWLRGDDEVRRFLAAAHGEDEHVLVFYATAVYTGMRAGELAALEWPDVDLDRRLITVQRRFDGPTKSDGVRYVPVLDPLLPLLRAWRLRHPGRLVFTNAGERMFAPSSRIFQEVLHRVLEAAEFPKVSRNGKERPYVRFHDLRHSFASNWVMRGGDLFKLQKILGHQSVQMTMRYAHLAYGPESRAGRISPKRRRFSFEGGAARIGRP